MASGEIHVNIAYDQIGETHVLFHCYGGRLVDIWLLIDLEERFRRTGKTVDQLFENLRRNLQKQEGEV